MTMIDMLTTSENIAIRIHEAPNCDALVKICVDISNARSGNQPTISIEQSKLFLEAVKDKADKLGY